MPPTLKTLAAVAAVLIFMPASASAADRDRATEAEIQAALQRDLGLTADEVKEQGALQAQAIKRDRELQASLGSAYAGSIYDAEKGELVTMVSDAKMLTRVRGVGAEAKLVKHSMAKLDAIKDELDVAAGGDADSNPADRQATEAKPLTTVAGLVSWSVDAATNTVHVTVKQGRAKTARAALAKYGDAVTIEQTDHVPTATADYMDGGDEINGRSCSAGFNLRNPATGQGYLLTAGHCVSRGSALTGQNGVYFGPVLESWWGTGHDDAIARNDNPGYWMQGPWVDTNPSNGGYVNVNGWVDPPLFAWTCKSGITTKWTCGLVVGKNETVVLDGVVVHNQTRHTACVEKGDSGGANVWPDGAGIYRAVGLSSGAMLAPDIFSGGRLRCLGAFGLPSVSWYYPMAQSMPYYAARYGATTW